MMFGSGAYLAVAPIERVTGEVRPERPVGVGDRAEVSNPLLAEGQIVGGIAQVSARPSWSGWYTTRPASS